MSTGLGGANTIAQSATSIASAVNEKDISFLQAQQKRLEAILEKIAMANELDIEHIKQMMQRSEQTLQTVSDIVQECAQTNTAVLAATPPWPDQGIVPCFNPQSSHPPTDSATDGTVGGQEACGLPPP